MNSLLGLTPKLHLRSAATLLALTTSVAFAQTTPSASDTSGSDTIVRMPTFTANASAADPFNAAESSSFARTSGRTLDAPMTINVVTPAMIKDLNPNTMFDVENYFAGVSPGRGSGVSGGFNDRVTLRGFENFGIVLDNFALSNIPEQTQNDFNFPAVFMDHVELVMGPDTIVSPNGAPGGTVNTIAKSPQFVPSVTLSAQIGNFDADQVSVDATGPIGDGKHMAYRVVAYYMDANTYMPGTNLNKGVEAAFTYKFTDTTKLVFKYFGFQERAGGTSADTVQDGEEVYTPDTVGGVTLARGAVQPGFTYRGWNGDASWSTLTNRNNIAQAELTSALGDHINMRLGAQVMYSDEHWIQGYPSPNIAETFNPQTGVVTSVVPITVTSVPELASLKSFNRNEVQLQNDFAGQYNVSGVNLQPLVGWAYAKSSTPVFYQVFDRNLPNENLLSNGGLYPGPIPDKSQFTSLGQNNPCNAWSLQTYAFLRAGFLHDRIFVTGGASRIWAGMNYYGIPYVNQDGINTLTGAPGPITNSTYSKTNNVLAPSVKPLHDSYMGGIVGKILPNVSLYYDYSTNAAIGSSSPVWQTGIQHEFGVKSSFFNNRLTISADHFQITQDNVSETNPLFNLGLAPTQLFYTDLANHGEEVNVTGGLTENLSVIASYTNMKLRDFADRRRRNIPDTMANLLVDYHFTSGFLKNSGLWLGAIHEGSVAGETQTGATALGVPTLPSFYLPEWTVLNGGAHYAFGRYLFSVNVNNILNSKFFWQAQSRISVMPYIGTNFIFTMTVKLGS